LPSGRTPAGRLRPWRGDDCVCTIPD
jgi:hypothetical protein